jgi:hypothetical protein
VVLGQRERGVTGGKAGPGRGHKTERTTRRLAGDGSIERTLARLRRDRPDLAVKVEAGEISVNQLTLSPTQHVANRPTDAIHHCCTNKSNPKICPALILHGKGREKDENCKDAAQPVGHVT